jgi:hypothetical protein
VRVPKDRGNDCHIRHVPHPGVRIVNDEHVIRTERAVPFAYHSRHNLKKDSELERSGIPWADQSPLTITNSRGKITNFDHRRASCFADCDGHFLCNGCEFVLNHLD